MHMPVYSQSRKGTFRVLLEKKIGLTFSHKTFLICNVTGTYGGLFCEKISPFFSNKTKNRLPI